MTQRKKKLGRGVAMVGAGMSAFGIRPDVTNRELFGEAFLDMKNSVDRLSPERLTGFLCAYHQSAGGKR